LLNGLVPLSRNARRSVARLRKLYLAYLRLRFRHTKVLFYWSGKESRMIVYKELASIEQDLGFSARTLYGLSNNLEKHYHNVFIPKSDGSKRKLSVPDLILKRVQKSIADNILVQYPISRYAKAYKPGSGIQQNARPHIGKKKLLKLDIEGFFDNINYSQVKDVVFYEEKFSEPIRVLLAMLCYYKESLPQGAPTSPAITNILMYDFDETVGSFCNNKKIAYTRYCDDMTFSGDFDESEIIGFVKRELRKLGLFLKNRKTAVIPATKRQTVTGIVVNEKLNITKEYKKNIRQEMYYIKKFGLDEHLNKCGISDRQKYVLSLRGRIAFVLGTVPNNREFIEYKNFLSETQ
jgi:retron-type reverse transcriptase